VWQYRWIGGGKTTFDWCMWILLSVQTGVFLYASFLCCINAFFPSALYCKQLEFIQSYFWKVLAGFAGICLLICISQFIAVKKDIKWLDMDKQVDAKILEVYTNLMAYYEKDGKYTTYLAEKVKEFTDSAYTAVYSSLIVAVVASVFAVIIWAIETQFTEMAAHIYEENSKDFQRAEMFAQKMQKPDSPKCCFLFGNMVASLLMFFVYLLPLIMYGFALKNGTLDHIVKAIGAESIKYFPHLFHGFLVIQVLVFLWAAILSLINAINPSMWCCKQIQAISTYLIILVSIFACISIGLAIHQGVKSEGKRMFKKAEEIENKIDENMKTMYKVRKDAELKIAEVIYENEPDKKKLEELKKKNDADIQKFNAKVDEDSDTARNFFVAAGIIAVIFILGLKYMESQFQAMCVFLYGYDTYAENTAVEDTLRKNGIAAL
jgi:hypothetical protein